MRIESTSRRRAARDRVVNLLLAGDQSTSALGFTGPVSWPIIFFARIMASGLVGVRLVIAAEVRHAVRSELIL